jgi:homoserine kinase
LVIKVPATSANLGPGFDCLGLALNLYNVVTVKRNKFFSISIKGEGSNNRKLKSNNIFVSIFNEYYQNLTGTRDNFKFIFQNNIPISRGLGSSSAVIVSAIYLAFHMAEVSISKEKLLALALNFEPHPDNITPATFGGFTVSIVDKTKVFTQKKVMPEYLKAVVVIPNRPISTAQSRTILPRSYSKDDAVFNLSRSSFLASCIFNEDWKSLALASKDRFHERFRMKALPELFNVQKLALENGALMSTLSGSGSTFFTMCYSDDAKRLAKLLKNNFSDFRVEILDFDNIGIQEVLSD